MENINWVDFKKQWIKDKRTDQFSKFYDEHPLIAHAVKMGDTFIGVIDVRTMKYIYLSPNIISFSGWPLFHFENDGVKFTFEQTHQSDQTGLAVFGKVVNDYFQNLTEDERPTFLTYHDFRMKNDKGKYFRMIQQTTMIRYDGGQVLEKLFFLAKIENLIPSEFQRLRIATSKEDLHFIFDHATKHLLQLENLSPRETEIAKLISKSMSLKEIAANLNISFNTVKNHSANMMKKLRVSDSVEMVNVMRVWGYL